MSVVVALSLVHFVWQGALIGAAAWIAMKLARTARVRYAIGVVGIVAMAVAPMATAVTVAGTVQGTGFRVPGAPGFLVQRAPVQSTTLDPGTSDPAPASTLNPAPGPLNLSGLLDVSLSPEAASKLLLAWILGVALLSLRLTLGFLTARRLTRVGVQAPAADVAALAAQVLAALGITRTVRVLESTLVRVPTVIGWLRPVVLLPVAAMSGLSTAQLEAVIAHECAHIKRFDYLVNLFQSVVETVLFYHPAVWLLSRRVRHERELCCDDLALQVFGDRVTYASALADLEGLRALPDPALAATGGSLLTRVRRILHHDERSASSSRPNWMAGAAVLMIALLAAPNVAKPEAVDLQVQAQPGASTPPPVAAAPVAADRQVPDGSTTPAAGIPADPQAGVTTKMEIVEADGFAPDTPADYRMTADDQLGLMVKTPAWLHEYDGPFTPNGAGQVTLPKVSTVPVVGKTVTEIVEAVRRRLVETKVAVNPKVDAIIVTPAQRKAMEAAQAPGPSPALQAPSGPVVTRGQVLHLEVTVGVIRQAEFSKDYTVQGNGVIVVPYVGEVEAAGLTLTGVQDAVARRLTERQVLPGAKVLASIEAAKPVVVTMPPVTTRQIPGYRLGGGDQIAVRAQRSGVEIYELAAQFYWVRPVAGNTVLPLVGPVQVDGLTVPELERSIQDGLALRGMPGASVQVSVVTYRAFAVTVQGAVRAPGRVTMSSERMTLPEVINQVGGLAVNSGDEIRIKRGGNSFAPEANVKVIDGFEIYSKHDLTEGRLSAVRLWESDQILVSVAAKYYVNGRVKTPGEQQWEKDVTILRALVKAGGYTDDAALSRIVIKRQDPATKKYSEIKMPKDIMSTPVLPEDIIEVPKRRM